MNTLQTLMERVEIYWCPNGCQYFPKRKRNTADEFLGKPYIGFFVIMEASIHQVGEKLRVLRKRILGEE